MPSIRSATRTTEQLVEELPAPEAAPRAEESVHSDTRVWLRERIDGRFGLAVGIAWVVLMQIAFALEPASNHEVPVIALVLELSMYALLATMIAGLVMQQRFGLVASLGAAVLATAASIACPLTGHHGFGSWWFGQMACVLALVAISAYALQRTRA